jgi:ABC-type multidrug transport system ATPase subunit
MVYISGLMKRFQQSRHPVINGIDFMFNRGEIAAVIGHNGMVARLDRKMLGLTNP